MEVWAVVPAALVDTEALRLDGRALARATTEEGCVMARAQGFVAVVVRGFLTRGWGIGLAGARGAYHYALRAAVAANYTPTKAQYMPARRLSPGRISA